MVEEKNCLRQNRFEGKRNEPVGIECLVSVKYQATSQMTGDLEECLSDWGRQHLDKEIGVLPVNMEHGGRLSIFIHWVMGWKQNIRAVHVQTNTPPRKTAAH